MARFQVIPVSPHLISGLGTSVSKIVDTYTSDIIGYVGQQDGNDVISFVKTMTTDQFFQLARQFARIDVESGHHVKNF